MMHGSGFQGIMIGQRGSVEEGLESNSEFLVRDTVILVLPFLLLQLTGFSTRIKRVVITRSGVIRFLSGILILLYVVSAVMTVVLE